MKTIEGFNKYQKLPDLGALLAFAAIST